MRRGLASSRDEMGNEHTMDPISVILGTSLRGTEKIAWALWRPPESRIIFLVFNMASNEFV